MTLLEPEDFDLPTVVINQVHVVVTDNVRFMLGEKVVDPRTGDNRAAVYHYAFVMSMANAEHMAKAVLDTIGQQRTKELARGFKPIETMTEIKIQPAREFMEKAP